MMEFVDCRTCKTDCVRADGNYGYTFCDKYTPTPMTNADRIRAMSDEELATFISEISDNCETKTECQQHCYGCGIMYCEYRTCLEWLRQPEEGDGMAQ